MLTGVVLNPRTQNLMTMLDKCVQSAWQFLFCVVSFLQQETLCSLHVLEHFG